MHNASLSSVTGVIFTIRRNHGLEHATVHLLAEADRSRPLAGYSGPRGFYLIGRCTAEEIRAAAERAIQRMQAGEGWLAVHPGCGTNLATSSLLTSGLAGIGAALVGRKARWTDRVGNALTFGMLGAVIAHPLGPWLQAHATTSADMRGARIVDVRRAQPGGLNTPPRNAIVHFVETAFDRD